jgi:CRISPR-associated endonuclease/helicase Cas3
MLVWYRGNPDYAERMKLVLRRSSPFHDLGKLSVPNQTMLASAGGNRLPLNHSDAGTRYLCSIDEEAAILVHGHHAGLANIREERSCGFRAPVMRKNTVSNEDLEWLRLTHEDTDRNLSAYIMEHERLIPTSVTGSLSMSLSGLQRRLCLSCLVEGDHGDAGKNRPYLDPPCPRWGERLAALDRYVASLPFDGSVRAQLRRDAYHACRYGNLEEGLASCAGVVGIGKTTACMAWALRVAIKYNLRHIYVVLPLTNIISQSVKTYRKSLVLDQENPAEVVAEHHHAVEFSSLGVRHLTQLWNSPIIVTTSVQFFETLTASNPSRLRKLNQLPGSVVFVDEVHGAMPLENWPLSLCQMEELVKDWGVHFLLASGSLMKTWEMSKVKSTALHLQDILPDQIRERSELLELLRVRCEWAKGNAWNTDEIIRRVGTAVGPRLVVLNTVQSAAVLAWKMRDMGLNVLHLSTALTARDREKTIGEVERRLASGEDDWTLVATSCVEAGMNFDFASAFREAASAYAVLQILGRLNREARKAQSLLVVFRVSPTDGMILNPALVGSANILERMFEEMWFSGSHNPTDIATEAMRRELELISAAEMKKNLLKEKCEAYREVEEQSRVIKDQTALVVIDEKIVVQLENGERVEPNEMARASVRMWFPKTKKLSLQNVAGARDELFKWNRNYDDFIGYMRGLIFEIDGYAII